MTDLNIVDLIEKNPISRLSAVYNNKLLVKIKEYFSNFEQQLFVSSFYCYLNYDKNNDFVVDLDNVWKWLGFASKFTSERLLETHFKVDVDYKISVRSKPEQDSNKKGKTKWRAKSSNHHANNQMLQIPMSKGSNEKGF